MLLSAAEQRILKWHGVDASVGSSVVLAPHGSTIAEMVKLAFPGLLPSQHGLIRVVINGRAFTPREWGWKPKLGTQIAMSPVAAGGSLGRSLLQILVVVAAITAAYFFGPAVGTAIFGTMQGAAAIGSALVQAGVLAAGMALVNFLIPVKSPESNNKQSFAVQGFQNQVPQPDSPIPQPVGRIRYAPVYAARPYTFNEGDDQYVVAAFCFGLGPMTLSDFKLGETPFTRFKEAVMEYREGLPDDEPLSLYKSQVIQETLSVTLSNADGPVTRLSAINADELSVDLTFPGGLYQFNSDGDSRTARVQVKIRMRKVGVDAWTDIVTLEYRRFIQRAFFKTHRWSVPERAQYEVEVSRLTQDFETNRKGQRVDQINWTALRTFRPEYPFNTNLPLALAAVRIKGTKQLNGVVNDFNAICETRIPDWDSAASAWITRVTRNPASIYRYMLQGAPNSNPVADSRLDLDGPFDSIQDFHAHCEAKGLTYDRVHDFDTELGDALGDVCAAGRAMPHDRGDKYGVIIDREKTLVAEHISPRNVDEFQGERAWSRRPDAFRVKFLDRANNWKASERVVPRPGLVGDPQRSVALDLPGVTDATLAYREALRRHYEMIHRPDVYTVTASDMLRATRGDLVRLNHDVLNRVQKAAVVLEVDDRRVLLDDAVTMEAGKSYACRFRLAPSDEDDPVTTKLRPLVLAVGDQHEITLAGSESMPEVGDVAMFGETNAESIECIIQGIERTLDLTDRVTLVAHAPEIEALTDAAVIPPWTSTVGTPPAPSTTIPAIPNLEITSGVRTSGDGAPVGTNVIFELSPGAGNAIEIATYDLRHRLQGAGTWIDVLNVNAADASVELTDVYDTGETLEAQARATSLEGDDSAYSSTVLHTVGATDAEDAETSGYYAADVGNGVDSTFTITHSLSSYDLEIDVFDNATKTSLGTVTKRRQTLDSVTLDFGVVVPTAAQYRVVVQRVGAAVA